MYNAKEYYQKNREKILAKMKTPEVKERINIKRREYYQKNKEKISAYTKGRRHCGYKKYGYRYDNHKRYKKYKLTIQDVENMLLKQNNKCFICQKEFTNNNYKIDHCHKSGLVRGLLCHLCNSAIGFLKDDTENLKRAIEYLKKYEGNQ